MARIWLDALTPKQVLFLLSVRRELEARGAEVLLTTRDYEELDLLEARLGVQTVKVGRHGGEGLADKLEASLYRSMDLYRVVVDFRPDVALITASPEAARIAYGLRVPLLAFNDSPHSEAIARLVVPLTSSLYSPWPIRQRDWVASGVLPRSYSTYRALDPAAWLLRRDIWPPRLAWEDARGAVVVRAGESRAYYYPGKVDELELARALSERYRVVLLSRYSAGIDVDGVRVLGPGFFGPYIIEGALALVGYGGTMNQESIMMGVPTVSTYPGSYRIEEYLVRRGLMAKASSVEDVIATVDSYISSRAEFSERARKFTSSMEDPAAVAAAAALEWIGKA